MLSTYTHVSESQVRDALLQQQGVEIPDARPAQPLKATQCPKCHYTNAPGIKYCGECGQPLTEEAAKSFEEKKRALARNKNIENEEIRRIVLELKEEGKI